MELIDGNSSLTLDNNTFKIKIDGSELPPAAIDSISSVASDTTADNSSSIEITLKSGFAVGAGQSIVVAYDPTSSPTSITDNSSSPNSLDAFQQAIHNNSTAAARDFTPPEVTDGSTNSNGSLISIQFDEKIEPLLLQPNSPELQSF